MNGIWKRYKHDGSHYTELTIKDYAETIHSMCPVKLFYNDILIWDDDTDPIEWYYEVLSKEILITKVVCEITHFHHADVYIYTR